MKIGFDLDKVFIGYPPLVPGQLIDWLYRNHLTNEFSYRIPTSNLEQIFRRSTHFPWFRRKIKKNVSFIQQLAQNQNHQLYLISSRYKFLEKSTYKLLQKYGLVTPFTAIHLNKDNFQPHLFKEKMINELKIDLFIDDDLELLRYLKVRCPNTKLLWYNPQSKSCPDEDIMVIKDLSQTERYFVKE